ncbi:hypothetical protein ABVT39_005278 [Epinephelus coioides]
MTTFDYKHWQQMLEWEAKNCQMCEAEERQRPATISPPPYPDPPTERGPHNESDHSLQDHTPRGASLIDARGRELLKELEGISRKTEGRLQQMSQLLETIQEQQLKEEGLQQEPEEPRASPTTEHITLTLQGTMKSNKTQAKEQYEPWPFMDMIGLAEHLPALTDGADKWIMALEETTAGIQLALGDVKALLTYVAGKQITQEIFTEANVGAAIGNNYSDDVDFGHYRSKVWRQLRKHYPAKRDPSKLEGETLGENECPSKFLHTFQKKWKEETGEAWNANKTTQSLFKMMVKKAMPESVQQRLEDMVGLMKMDLPLFSEHIVHHVERYRKDKKKKDEEDKQLANKLTQLQLGELSKLVKKEKEKSKIQASVVAATQAAPPNIQPQAPLQPPPTDPNATGKETSTSTTHHHYYYQQIPREGTPHDCIHDTEKFMRAREDLHNQPIPADLTLFVDGSCFRDATGSHAGYGIIQLNNDDQTFDTLQARVHQSEGAAQGKGDQKEKVFPSTCERGFAESVTVTYAIRQGESKRMHRAQLRRLKQQVLELRGQVCELTQARDTLQQQLNAYEATQEEVDALKSQLANYRRLRMPAYGFEGL